MEIFSGVFVIINEELIFLGTAIFVWIVVIFEKRKMDSKIVLFRNNYDVC